MKFLNSVTSSNSRAMKEPLKQAEGIPQLKALFEIPT